MATLTLVHPPQGHSVAHPFTVILAWSLSQAEREETQKRYEERKRKYEAERAKNPAIWPDPDPDPNPIPVCPYIARINVEGVPDWYQWHFEGNATPNHRYTNLTTSVTNCRILAQLIDTTSGAVLDEKAVTVCVV